MTQFLHRPLRTEWDKAEPTPLKEIYLPCGIAVLLKLEGDHEAGSHKVRAIQRRMNALRAMGHIGGAEPAVLIMSSSGRAAEAAVKATAGIYNLTLIVVTDVLSPSELTAPLQRFDHVRLEVVNRPDANRSHLAARLELIEELRKTHPKAIVIDQYGDDLLPLAYQESLVAEVIEQSNAEVSSVFVPAGTCAMLRAFDRDKIEHERRYSLVGIDAVGSSLFRPAPTGSVRRFPGYGNAKPTRFARQLRAVDAVVHVDDLDVARTARQLVDVHGLCLGPSSVAAIAGLMQATIEKPSLFRHWGVPVVICPDRGEPYSSTLYDDEWLMQVGLGKAVSQP